MTKARLVYRLQKSDGFGSAAEGLRRFPFYQLQRLTIDPFRMTQQLSLPLKHWGLESWPFRSLPGVGQFYPTAGHNEALARIEHLVEGRRRAGVLLGQSGVGKSLLLKVAARELSRKGAAV